MVYIIQIRVKKKRPKGITSLTVVVSTLTITGFDVPVENKKNEFRI